MSKSSTKRERGQFYTVNNEYILDGFRIPNDVSCIIEPFAGQADLVGWTQSTHPDHTFRFECYDIDPKHPMVQLRDTLRDPPDYRGKYILTNPPYLARNKTADKEVFDQYNTNDLYKCFIHSISQPSRLALGGIIIIPAGFFFSPRSIDTKCRDEFLRNYRILSVRYFEEQVFPDTPTTVVAIQFEMQSISSRADSDNRRTQQSIPWTRMPSGETRTFQVFQRDGWIIGGEVYNLPVSEGVRIRRYVEGESMRDGEVLSNLTLTALDSGSQSGRIRLDYRPDYVYPGKDTSRSYATLCFEGIYLTPEEQMRIAERFNRFIEEKREETWSLFLPQYRESKEYARKRIPFELAYRIVSYLLNTAV